MFFFFKVKLSTPCVMLYGDFGRTPISVCIKNVRLDFWFNMLSNDSKLSSRVFKVTRLDFVSNNHMYE